MARNSPPRQRISVACPHCGHQQEEPLLVVSSYCRRCRLHFEVANGKVVLSRQSSEPAFGPPADQRPDPPAPAPPPAGPPIRTYQEKEPEEPAPTAPVGPPIRIYQEKEPEEPAPTGTVGPPIRIYQEKEPEEPAPAAPVGPPIRTRREEQPELVFEAPPSGPPVPPLRTRKEDEAEVEPPKGPVAPPVPTRGEDDPIPEEWSADPPSPAQADGPSGLNRLRDWIRPKPPRRTVLCDQCGREFTAPAIANASNCPDCGCWLSLTDFEITEFWNEDVATRGNVTIRRKGRVVGTEIVCHDLLVDGHLEGGARCTGALVIRRSGMIRGKVRCKELRVERWARVQFIHPVDTGKAMINGQVTGSIRAESTVTLLGRSRITGNVAATELIMKRSARHNGRLRIIEPAEPSAAPESTV